jgi:hypothetical protein
VDPLDPRLCLLPRLADVFCDRDNIWWTVPVNLYPWLIA